MPLNLYTTTHCFHDWHEDGTGGLSILEAANDHMPCCQLWASFTFNCRPLNSARFVITKERESEHLTELLGRLMKWTHVCRLYEIKSSAFDLPHNSTPNLIRKTFNGRCEYFFFLLINCNIYCPI
jgi:hypothetical protein